MSEIDILNSQEDKTVISKLLFKELINSTSNKIPIICFLLEHFVPKEELISKLWEALNNKSLQSEVKITIINLLREWDADWSYEECSQYLDDADEILDESTRQLLNSAIINPEVQIDFMDFMASLNVEDKITLINSFGRDFSDDALANILIPVFVSSPNSAVGREALKLLADTKSQLALHILEKMNKISKGELNQEIRRSLASIKMSGIRTDNTKEFYSKILSNSKPDKFYLTYPDGRGDMAMICTRLADNEKIRFISIVINIETGIKDCFGFFEISQFECDKILEKFLCDEKVASLKPEVFKTILYNSEITTIQHSKDWKLPYEYVCWKNLLVDIDYDEKLIEQILKEKLVPISSDESIFNEIQKMKISTHWFLDKNYSDEFEQLLEELKNSDDLDYIVEKYKDIVFYPEEKAGWIKKIYYCAYIKYELGKEDEAEKIYGLTFDENLVEKFLVEILKRSIYEYLITIKYNKDLNNLNFTNEEILNKISYIENKWVK